MNLGEYAESLFTTKCIKRGYIVSKPFGHETRYDFIVDINNTLSRVQVKSTNHLRSSDNQFQVRLGYTKVEVDWLAIYIKPINTWFVVPIQAVKGIQQFSYKKDKKSKYNKYKNNFAFVK